ncbi:ATP-binding cassette sub-family G member 8 [Bienertia sinuspersici]
MEALKKNIHVQGLLGVSCSGERRKRRGGLALMWNECINILINSYFLNHIDTIVNNSVPVHGGSYVTHLSKRRSNHLSILLTVVTCPNLVKKKKKKKLFHFEEIWLSDDSSEAIINNAWGQHGSVEMYLS